MATVYSLTSTYAGKEAAGFIRAALLASPTVFNGGVEVRQNIKYKQVIRRLSTDGLVKNATCDFTDTSTITQDERILAPEYFQVNLELCKADFYNEWESDSMGFSALNQTLPKSFQEYLLLHIAEKVAEATEQTIWTGVNASAGQFDGFLTLFAADASVIDVTGTTVTASNVITELGKVVDAIPAELRWKEDMYIYCPDNVVSAYIRALGGFGTSGLGAAGVGAAGPMWYSNGTALSFDGIKLFRAPGITSNKMVAAQKSNLFFGTGLLGDHNEVKLIDTSETLGDNNVRVVMRFSQGIQYGFSDEIVLYS